MSRKKKTVDRVTFRIDEDTQCLLEEYMKVEELNKSEAVTQVLDRHLTEWLNNQALGIED